MEIIKLNLIPSGVNPICHAKQYDEGRIIRFMLFDGLTPYTLQSGDTVALNLRKPDNTIIETSVTATQGNKYVDLVTTEQICAVAGYNLGTFKITNGSVDIGTLNFIMEVGKDVLANGIPSQSVIEDLDALVQEAVGDNYYTKNEVDTAIDNALDPLDRKVDQVYDEVYGPWSPETYLSGFMTEYNGKAVHNVSTAWVYVVLDVSDYVGVTLTISTYSDRTRKILFVDNSENVVGSATIDTGNPNLYNTIDAVVPQGSTKCYVDKYATGQNDVVVDGLYIPQLAKKSEIPNIVNDYGESETSGISQKFITDNFSNGIEKVSPINNKLPIVDEDIPIYLDNLFRGVSPKELRLVDVNNAFVHIYDKTVATLPSASNSGSSCRIRLHLIDDFKFEKYADVAFTHISEATANKKALFIGDSITENLSYLTPLKALSDNGDYKLTFLGTLGSTIKNEGRGGWAAYNYCNDASYSGKTNAFWDGSKFNFAWYLSQNSIEDPDFIFINLGTNDLIRGITDPSDDAEVKSVIVANYETMINSIRSYSANIPIILWLPPTRSMVGRNNHTGIDNALRANKFLIEQYDKTSYINNKVYLMHTYLFVNPYTDYTMSDITINGVTYKDCSEPIHPTSAGGEKIAKGIIRQMMYIDDLLT